MFVLFEINCLILDDNDMFLSMCQYQKQKGKVGYLLMEMFMVILIYLNFFIINYLFLIRLF